MYLDEIYLENTGPISKLHVHLPFADDSNPRPVVVVGPNGSGKSIFLSYIVDALMEFAKTVFPGHCAFRWSRYTIFPSHQFKGNKEWRVV